MANHEQLNPTEIPQKSLIDEIRTNGLRVLKDNPHIADNFGNPGHHLGSFWIDLREDGILPDINENEFYDGTNFWMTESIDTYHWFGRDKEFLQALGFLSMQSPTITEFSTPEYAGFLDMMHGFWPELVHIFCYNAGTLATDAAGKAMVAQIMKEEGLNPEDMKIAALTHAFHGRAGWGLELTDTTSKTIDWQTGKAVRIPTPANFYDEIGNIDQTFTQIRIANALEKLEDAFRKDPVVAGIMLEYPFQAEGGALVISPSFLTGARKLCDTYHRFLTVDAVQMAGKGYPFPPEALAVADYVTFGKFFRVCGVMAKDPTKRGFKEDHMAKEGKYGATWAGRLADMVAAQAIVSIIEKNNLWENGRQQADRMYQGLRELAAAQTGILRPRIAGAYVGFDFATREERDEFVSKMRNEYHEFLLPAGETAIRWSPRLDADDAQIDSLLEVFVSLLKKIACS